MSYEDNSGYDNSYGGDDAPLPEESNNNRTFMIAVGILGGIILIAIACLVGVYLFGQSGSTAAQEQAIANATGTAQAAAAFINDSLTATFQASILPTTTPVLPTSTLPVNNATPTLALSLTPSGPDPATATVAAALTQAAAAQQTIIPTTTALPKTGFMDDFGVPGLVVMALAFMIVILLARRLRTAPATIR